MQKYLFHALIVTAMVLVTVFVVRKIPVIGGYADKALNG